MAETENEIPKPVLDSLKSSGFPFQTAVRYTITRTPSCTIHASEYPWRGADNEDQFLDIVAIAGKFVLAIECKKTRQDGWTFLLPLGGKSTSNVDDFRCLRVEEYFPIQRQVRVFCETFALRPPSPEAEFCVISGTGAKDRMLERDASMVVRASEAFARDLTQHLQLAEKLAATYLILPVIVTNTRLYTARYEPTEISLETGEFIEMPEDLKPVPWIRFAKTLSVDRGFDPPHQSVFVVNSTSLREFLGDLKQIRR